jgi:DNA-binding Lrp family transcriptional regulator
MITAVVLIRTDPGRTADVGEALVDIPEVAEVYSVTGEYDLVALLRVRRYEEIAAVVPERIVAVPGVARTNTLLAFRHYSRHDIEGLFTIGLESEPQRGG